MLVFPSVSRPSRRGTVAPLTALLLVILLAMVAFAVDLGYVAVVHTEAHSAADAAALAGCHKLFELLKTAPIRNGRPVQTQRDIEQAEAEAREFARRNLVGGEPGDRDIEVEVGFMANPEDHSNFNAASELDFSGWPQRPYNAVRVRIRRNNLGLFFGRVLGVNQANPEQTATAMFPMGRVRIRGGVIPFAMHINMWNALLNGSPPGQNIQMPVFRKGRFSTQQVFLPIQDRFGLEIGDDGNTEVQNEADQTNEIRLFPLPSSGDTPQGQQNVPGDFGTVDIGNTNNAATDIARQLLNGPADSDFPTGVGGPTQSKEEFHAITDTNNQVASPGVEKVAPVKLEGDPGLSLGPLLPLADDPRVIGQPRLAPIFDTVTNGPGNTDHFRIIGFAPITILEMDFKGQDLRMIIQPRLVTRSEFFELTTDATPNPLFALPPQLVR